MTIGAARVFHLNVNCSDLQRSRHFYCDLLGLKPQVQTKPESPQPGGAFGLDTAQWDAWILTDDRGFDGVAIDLLEWQVPRPAGTPYPVANHLGFARLGFISPDIDASYERFEAAGVDCFGPPHDVDVGGAPDIRAFVCADPDGVPLELLSGDENRLAFVAINCCDLDRSTEFYGDILGFHPLARFAPGPRDEANLRMGPDCEWEMSYLVQWHKPASEGTPYDTANHVGIYRMALTTDDIDRDYAELVDRGVRCVSPPAELDMGPGLPLLRALLFADPDGTMLELIESPSG